MVDSLAVFRTHRKLIIIASASILLLIAIILIIIFGFARAVQPQDSHNHLITVYDRGVKSVFLSDANTVSEALKEEKIPIDSHDVVEPSLNEELIASDYWVNIYRARPITVIDGALRMKTITAYQTPAQIAKDVGLSLYPEDGATLSRSTDFVGDGAGLELTITRSVPLQIDLYGKTIAIRTLGKTVREMLKEKGVTLTDKDHVTPELSTPITAGMNVRVWREGKQTTSIDQAIPFETVQIYDADRLVGYKNVTTPGKDGVKSISYEIEIKDGVEISRTQIAQIVTQQPTKQVEVIGIKNGPYALTKAKGAQQYTDSKGVTHRETYYDLDMGTVMRSCGQGGYYEIRIDGVKVDRDGYVIVAANYSHYPKCSVVETSVGAAKVYDTGGFASRYPDGFDIATDWSNYNGR